MSAKELYVLTCQNWKVKNGDLDADPAQLHPLDHLRRRRQHCRLAGRRRGRVRRRRSSRDAEPPRPRRRRRRHPHHEMVLRGPDRVEHRRPHRRGAQLHAGPVTGGARRRLGVVAAAARAVHPHDRQALRPGRAVGTRAVPPGQRRDHRGVGGELPASPPPCAHGRSLSPRTPPGCGSAPKSSASPSPWPSPPSTATVCATSSPPPHDHHSD